MIDMLYKLRQDGNKVGSFGKSSEVKDYLCRWKVRDFPSIKVKGTKLTLKWFKFYH